MLQPSDWAMHREPALAALDQLLALLRAGGGPQPADLLRRLQPQVSQVHRNTITDR